LAPSLFIGGFAVRWRLRGSLAPSLFVSGLRCSLAASLVVVREWCDRSPLYSTLIY
jgi:hypothetical protein